MTINNRYGEEFNIIPSSYEENKNKYNLNSVLLLECAIILRNG